MKQLIFAILLVFLSGCVQQPSNQLLSHMVQDCLNKGGEYFLESENEGAKCGFEGGIYCYDEDYYSEIGCYPKQIGTRELILCENFEGLDVCTMQYNPVCAKIGSDSETRWQTFSNNCVACVSSTSVNKIIGYVEGKCEDFSVIK